MLKSFTAFWLRHIHPHLSSLITTIGIVGLASCLLILFIVAKLAKGSDDENLTYLTAKLFKNLLQEKRIAKCLY